MYLSLDLIGNFNRALISFHTEQKPTGRATQTIMMPSAGLLAPFTTFLGFKLIQAKVGWVVFSLDKKVFCKNTKTLLIETEDNSKPMTKEEVETVPSVILKEAKETYNRLSKTVKRISSEGNKLKQKF